MKNKVTTNEEVRELKDQLREVVKAYELLEEYTCQLLGSGEASENETIIHCNSIVDMALHRL